MQVFKATFPDQPVASLTGDREFIANAWIEWLRHAAIPHFLRLREDMHVFNDSHAPLSLRQHGGRLKTGQRLVLKGCWRVGGSARNASPPVRIVILRLKTGELPIIASHSRPQHALNWAKAAPNGPMGEYGRCIPCGDDSNPRTDGILYAAKIWPFLQHPPPCPLQAAVTPYIPEMANASWTSRPEATASRSGR